MNRRRFMASLAGAGLAAPLALRNHPAAAQAGPAPPTNVRLVTSPPAGLANRQLLGGWRIAQEFPRGAIAIDFSTNRLWMAGHAQRAEIVEYTLGPMGTGTNIASWPALTPTRVIPSFWQGGNVYGLAFFQGKLWVAPRIWYAQSAQASELLTLYAEDGSTIVTSLFKQRFAGFVKRGPGLDPYLGAGGYDSGQGTVSGPTLATLAGQVLITHGWPGTPGAVGANGVPANWNQRAPREPNAWPIGWTPGRTPVGQLDSWLAWEPRVINGVLEGRWASDRIIGGGLVLPDGITYWPWMGTGALDYNFQTYTFTPDDSWNRTYAYRYDPTTYAFIDYTARPEFGSGAIVGQELGPDGRVYLAHSSQWQSGTYKTDVALRVFG